MSRQARVQSSPGVRAGGLTERGPCAWRPPTTRAPLEPCRERACSSSSDRDVSKPHLGHDFSQIPAETTSRVQRKLAFSTPDDVYEREADLIADQVMGMREPAVPLVQRQTRRPTVQRQEPDRPREQPSTFPVHQQPPEGRAIEDELEAKLKKGGGKVAEELGKILWDLFSNSEVGKAILAANERDWKSILKFFEDFAGRIALAGAVGGAIAGAVVGALSARDAPGADPDFSPSTGGPVPRAPKDEQLFGLELHWDFVTTPTGLTLKTPWLDSPRIPFGAKAPAAAPPPAPPVMFKPMPKTPRICTVTDPHGDQGEADSRSAFIFWWLLQNRQLAERQYLKWLATSRLHAPPKLASSVLRPLFKRDLGADGGVNSEMIDAGLRSPGQPLDQETQAFMEPRFGHDFSGVRVHCGAGAAQSARAVSALAYTVGQDIVFDSGRFAPQTSEGRRLLAHELTHVVQQSGAPATRSPANTAPDVAPPSMLNSAGLIQRVPDEMDRLIGDDNWHKAAQTLAKRDPADIAARVRGMSSLHRRYLVEGARHGEVIWNTDVVVSIVNEVSPRDAIIGSVRYFVWKHAWDKAGEYLCGLSDDDMRQAVSDLRLTVMDRRAISDTQELTDKARAERLSVVLLGSFAAFKQPTDPIKGGEKVVEGWLLSDPLVGPFAAKRFQARRITGHLHIIPADKWTDLWVQLSAGRNNAGTGGKPQTTDELRATAWQVPGFFDGRTGEMYVREGESWSTLIHEATHSIAPVAFKSLYGVSVNEGATEYFARHVARNALMHQGKSYPDEHDGIAALARLVGDDLLARAFFTGDGFAVRERVDNLKGVGTFFKWVAAMQDEKLRKFAPYLLYK